MGVTAFQMKTHSRTDLTAEYPVLNPCIVHGTKPEIVEIVAGRRKYRYFCALCRHDDCGKIADTAEDVVRFWNKWNPVKQ